MEYCHGSPFVKGVQKLLTKIAQGRGVTEDQLREDHAKKIRAGKFDTLEGSIWNYKVVNNLLVGLDFNPGEIVKYCY